jgi:hypothetical protein
MAPARKKKDYWLNIGIPRLVKTINGNPHPNRFLHWKRLYGTK